MIFDAFFAALGQLGDRRFVWVVAKSVGITILALFLLTLGLQWLLPDTVSLPWIGEVAWLGAALDGAAVVAMLVASIFLMIPISSVVIGLFLEEVADAVEDVHYPAESAPNRITLSQGTIEGLQFLGLMIVVNLFALILYLVFAPLAPVIFIVLNGILLGREYAQLVAMRHVGRKGAKAFRARNRLTIWVAGMLMALPLMVPILNLLVPVFGVATYTHIYQKLRTA